MNAHRHYTPFDRALIELDHAARTIVGQPGAKRDYPAAGLDNSPLTDNSRRLAARLMRVNNAGEVSAQALYRGQAAVTPTRRVRHTLLQAADEEQDHLAWCSRRLGELSDRRSRLDGVWYVGSFAIGALAGIAGDRYSLGFVAETERQVERHLDSHLHRLPADDARSRRVVETMQQDEIRHGHTATRAGGRILPRPVRTAMRWASRVMTTAAARI